MIVYNCIFSGDELISDSFGMKLVDEVVFEVIGKSIVLGEDNIDIGANASAEEAAEDLDDSKVTVIDVVNAFKLVETGFSKKEYMTYIKKYMKNVKTYLAENHPDQVEVFMTNIQVYIKKIISNFDEYQFFMGESCDPEASIILCHYDGMDPVFTYFKHGLKEIKC